MNDGHPVSENVLLFKAEGSDHAGFACVTFGGIAQGLGVPVFEFFRTLQAAGIDSLFIRDPSQGWYQKPIPDLGPEPQAMAERISALVAECLPRRPVVAVGNSMGGFAAMLFSKLCGFEAAVAFSPQTFITPELRARHDDHRWQEKIDAIPALQLGDLRSVLAQGSAQVKIFSGARDRLDVVHARHLEGLPRVSVTLLPECGHDASRWLKGQGRLEEVILEMGRDLRGNGEAKAGAAR